MAENRMFRDGNFTRPGGNPLVKSVDFGTITEAGSDARISMLISEIRPGPSASQIKYIRIPVGGGGHEKHKHSFDQTFYQVSGTLTIEVDGEAPFTMEPGDVITFPAGMAHANHNGGPDEVVHLSIQTPAR